MDQRAMLLYLVPHFRLVVGAVPAMLPFGAQRLVAYLAVNRHPVARTSAAARLWPDLHDERAAATMRSTLWQTRRRAPGVVVADARQVRLNPAVQVDLYRAMQLAECVETGAEGPADTEVLNDDLLPEWTDDWIVADRERYRQIRLHALERLCRRLTTDGHSAAAIAVGIGAVAADPLRETAQRALIEAHIADGNVSEAVRQYEVFASTLREALGVDPTPELASLVPRRLGPARRRLAR